MYLQRPRLPDERGHVVIKMPAVSMYEGREDHTDPLSLMDYSLETDTAAINRRPVEITTYVRSEKSSYIQKQNADCGWKEFVPCGQIRKEV